MGAVRLVRDWCHEECAGGRVRLSYICLLSVEECGSNN
jgi:hypothetical protein